MNLYRDSNESPSFSSSSVILNLILNWMNLNHEKEQRIQIQRMIRKKGKKKEMEEQNLYRFTKLIGTKKKRDIEVFLIIHEYYYFNSGFVVTLTG